MFSLWNCKHINLLCVCVRETEYFKTRKCSADTIFSFIGISGEIHSNTLYS